MFKLQKKLGWM